MWRNLFSVKLLCFQHILINTFRRMCLKCGSHSLKGIFILDIPTTFRLQKPQCKNIRWRYSKNESHKSCLGNKEQNAMFPVVCRHALWFCTPVLCWPDRARYSKFVQICCRFESLRSYLHYLLCQTF